MSVLIKGGNLDSDTDMEEDGHVRTEAKISVGSHKPTKPEAATKRQLENARKHSPLEALEEACPCQHIDFGFLASRIVRQQISVVLATQFVALSYGSPSKLILPVMIQIPTTNYQIPRVQSRASIYPRVSATIDCLQLSKHTRHSHTCAHAGASA